MLVFFIAEGIVFLYLLRVYVLGCVIFSFFYNNLGCDYVLNIVPFCLFNVHGIYVNKMFSLKTVFWYFCPFAT